MKISRQTKTDITGYSFISFNLLGFIIFTAIPVFFSLVVSFTDWDYTQGFKSMKFVFLKNFIEMWKDEWFLASLKNTIIYAIVTVPAILALSVVIAVLIDRFVVGKVATRLALFIPYISNVVAISIVWVMMFSPYGPIAEILRLFGVNNPNWLADYNLSLISVMIVGVWSGIGYAVLIYSSAIQSLPEELYEAAAIDGANEFKKFFKITIPLLTPTTFFLLVTTLIGAFQVFGQVKIMTGGGPGTSSNVLVYYIYTTAFRFYRMGYASAISWILFVIIFIITIIQWRGQKKWVNY